MYDTNPDLEMFYTIFRGMSSSCAGWFSSVDVDRRLQGFGDYPLKISREVENVMLNKWNHRDDDQSMFLQILSRFVLSLEV